MRLRGNVVQNGRAIAAGLNVSLKVQGGRWSGHLEIPKGVSLHPGGYQLQLNDRRRGRIMINVVEDDFAFFEGDGDLKSA